MACERVALRGADPGAVAGKAAELLRRGALVALPTETVYGLAVLPSRPEAVAAARALKGRGTEHPFTWHLARRDDLPRLCQAPPVRVQRLLDRYWPGPLTVVLPGRDGGTAGVRLPAHAFARDVIARCGEPLWLTSVNRTGEPPLCDPAAIARDFGDGLALVVDDGRSPLGSASTVVRSTGPALEVLREGILAAAEVFDTAAAHVLFVCTGNTCRSPMAEVLARARTAQALGCRADEVLPRGLAFASAGTGTMDGMPASDGSLLAAHEVGLDLSAHQSHSLDAATARRAAFVYCLARSHLQRVQALVPDLGDRVCLLRPDGRDIADPFGGGSDEYRQARDEIAAAVQARVPEWTALLG